MKANLIKNYENLYRIKNMIDTIDENYITTTIINKRELDTNTISIVMTSCNRSIQTYFTIETISKSIYKNVQIILIDDSTNDFVSVEKLEQYDIHIELIHIKNKFWYNPCVNYNIGFKHIKGGTVIIQNAEVCHIGDVLNYVGNNINDDEYHAFNVYALNSINENKLLYEMNNTSYDNHQKIIQMRGTWYQHHIRRNAYFHFLVALTKKTLNKIGGFDIDYAYGNSWDDDALVFKIINNNIKLINVTNVGMGIHQWHPQSAVGYNSNTIANLDLYNRKREYYKINKAFLNLTSYDKNEVVNIINEWF